MNSSYLGLGVGIAFAILLVYFLMAVNFRVGWIRLSSLWRFPAHLPGLSGYFFLLAHH